MTIEELMNSFAAFNTNALNSLIYNIQTNLWLILIIIGTLAITIMNLMEEIEDVVPEEQDIL